MGMEMAMASGRFLYTNLPTRGQQKVLIWFQCHLLDTNKNEAITLSGGLKTGFPSQILSHFKHLKYWPVSIMHAVWFLNLVYGSMGMLKKTSDPMINLGTQARACSADCHMHDAYLKLSQLTTETGRHILSFYTFFIYHNLINILLFIHCSVFFFFLVCNL